MQKRFLQPKDWQWGSMVNADGIPLRTGALARHSAPEADIIVGQGLGEFLEKYFETAAILTRLKYNVYGLDWRGQGGSPRYLSDRFRRHAIGLDRDARDLFQYTSQIPGNAPKFYLGHSMGGLIGTLAMLMNPKAFRAGILSAPLYGVADPRLAGHEALLARLPLPQMILQRYIPSGGPWVPRTDAASPLKPADYSSDADRMTINDAWTSANPGLRTGAPTIGFVQAISRPIAYLRQKGIAESLRVPLLLLSAGQDLVVKTSETFNLAARFPGAFHTHIADANHELLMEKASIRRPVMRNIHNFIQAHLS